LFDEWKKDERFQFIHAIVFLSLKRKGRGTQYSPVEFKDYKVLVERALKENIPVGFDSCSAHKFLSSVKDSPHYIQYEMASEPCESGCFSSYVNAKGEFYPCSFVEGVGDWTEGISVLNSNSFLDIWNDQRVVLWRENLLKHRRHCPVFSI
jgi:MoaA/NifB/PqqE/SkfB family radical SAM enzyme